MKLKFTVSLLLIFTVLVYSGVKVEATEEYTVDTSEDLQQVFDKAEKNDVITVKPGIYEGNFTINTSVTVIGEDGAIIKGPNEGNVITVNADDVTIENFQIEGGGSQNAGIHLRSNRNIIKKNKLYNVFHGVTVRDGYGNIITENMITSFKESSIKGFAIYLVEAPNSRVTNNYSYDTNDGIYLSFSDFCEVSNNYIKKARYGVHTMDSKDGIIAENFVTHSRIGLMIMQSYNFHIKNNYLYSNTQVDGTGMFIFDTFDSRISTNVMKMNNKGMFLENAIDNMIEFNIIEGNEKGIQVGKDSFRNEINLNNFVGNNLQVISHEKSDNEFSWEGIGNFWDNQRTLNLSESKTNDYAFKSGDVFYNLTMHEPYLQIFTGSPAVWLWNTIEQFVPMVSKKFIVDEYPLAQPVPIDLNFLNVTANKSKETNSPNISWKALTVFSVFISVSLLIILIARREQHV